MPKHPSPTHDTILEAEGVDVDMNPTRARAPERSGPSRPSPSGPSRPSLSGPSRPSPSGPSRPSPSGPSRASPASPSPSSAARPSPSGPSRASPSTPPAAAASPSSLAPAAISGLQHAEPSGPSKRALRPPLDVEADTELNIRDTTPQIPVPVDAPTRLGRYTLLGLLGKGGMAEVYLAKQDGPAGFAKQCVVKRIRRSLAEEPRFVEMFLREARVAARLNHPNAVQIFELGQDDGEYFLAMEFLDGVSLHRAARRSWHHGESVPMEVALRAVADAALGLQHAHSLTASDGRATPLVHRDVSPDNIMLTRDGVSKVLDFGIAKSTDVEEMTGTGEVKGKIPFMSPEQLKGEPLDGRSDLWSLGVTLYWLLTGKRPFDANTEPMTIDGILRRDPLSPRALNPLIPVPVEKIILQLLEKDREKRIKSGAELSDQLLAMLGPSAGYSAAAAFAARAIGWPDHDPKQPMSALTILAARPESQWLKRLDRDPDESADIDDGAAKLDRLFPEMTPTGKQRARREPDVPTAGTVTGIERQVQRNAKVLPIAAGVVAALVVAAVLVVVLHNAKDDAKSVDAEPWVVPVAPTASPTTPTPTPTPTPSPAPTPPTTPTPATTTRAGDEDKHDPIDGPRPVVDRSTIKLVAPSRISWRANGRGVGSGNGSVRLARGTSSLTAVDNETGGTTTVNVVDGVADYNAVGSGTLNVRVKPWADVEIGHKKLGTTPIDPVTLKAGHYTVHLQRESMQKTLSVDVKPNAVSTVTADMRGNE